MANCIHLGIDLANVLKGQLLGNSEVAFCELLINASLLVREDALPSQ